MFSLNYVISLLILPLLQIVWEEIYQNVPKIVYKLYDMHAIELGR